MADLEFVYCACSFTRDGNGGGMVGIFSDREEAIHKITKQASAHEVYEFYYRYVCLEKYHANVFVHPIAVIGKEREILWFEWKMDHPVDDTDVPEEGSYVACECPEWAKRTFGFAKASEDPEQK